VRGTLIAFNDHKLEHQEKHMLSLSEVMLQNYEMESFTELEKVISEKAKAGAIHFQMDVKPTYSDTPEDWEDKLEAAFNTRR